VQSQVTGYYQSCGPTLDNRIKPDIQAPTNTETASNVSDTSLQVFTGTSGATPYAGGAAALLRERLRGSNSSLDPGQVYSHLILSGRQPLFDNNTGVGVIFLPPVNGTEWFGKVSVANGATIDIPLNILAGGSLNNLNGALWWPETIEQTHNDIDLYLVDPSGTERVSSLSGPSVFERARVDGTITTGSWKLRIRGYSVTGSQTVYWSAHVRRS
jgi:subtilisin family serine protease